LQILNQIYLGTRRSKIS